MAQDKKLIIDEDWKEEARKEKEVLISQEQQDSEKKAEAQSSDRSAPLPPADLPGLISMLATQSFFALGVVKTKEDEEPRKDLEMAKFNIDMLGVIEEKTKGNLTDQEAGILSDTLQQLRMVYVQVSGS
ncbi:MAG: DUF1844 domain-containing protein [Planctomycetes bacterium]|nr:DUF1844 domain-containing protein [Planctomycetota bacterium]